MEYYGSFTILLAQEQTHAKNITPNKNFFVTLTLPHFYNIDSRIGTHISILNLHNYLMSPLIKCIFVLPRQEKNKKSKLQF